MRSIAFSDLLVGVGMLFVIEGLLIAGLPSWVKRAMENVIRTPDHIMRVTGLVSAVGGLLLIWAIRH